MTEIDKKVKKTDEGKKRENYLSSSVDSASKVTLVSSRDEQNKQNVRGGETCYKH